MAQAAQQIAEYETSLAEHEESLAEAGVREEELQQQNTELLTDINGSRNKKGYKRTTEEACEKLEMIKVNLRLRYSKVPDCELNGTNQAKVQNINFLAAALHGRDPDAIAAALVRNGQLDALFATAGFQSKIKEVINGVLATIQVHIPAHPVPSASSPSPCLQTRISRDPPSRPEEPSHPRSAPGSIRHAVPSASCI